MLPKAIFDQQELDKCKNSPWYFATTYMTIKDEKGNFVKFTTNLTEEEFNEKFKDLTRNIEK